MATSQSTSEERLWRNVLSQLKDCASSKVYFHWLGAVVVPLRCIVKAGNITPFIHDWEMRH